MLSLFFLHIIALKFLQGFGKVKSTIKEFNGDPLYIDVENCPPVALLLVQCHVF